MSLVTRRKHVLKEMMEDNYELPKKNQQIVRVVCSRGNNLYEVESASENEHFLVSMPKKFRQNIYVKRGGYVLVEAIGEGHKVKAEIHKFLTPEHIEEYTKANVWPERFAIKTNKYSYMEDEVHNKYFENDSDDDDLEPNMNRPIQRNIYYNSDVDDGDEDDGDEDSEDEDGSDEDDSFDESSTSQEE